MAEPLSLDNVVCECCGTPASARNLDITFGKDWTTILCDLCAGLIASGMLRPEEVDGRTRYRQWHFEWHPGELLPAQPKAGAS